MYNLKNFTLKEDPKKYQGNKKYPSSNPKSKFLA